MEQRLTLQQLIPGGNSYNKLHPNQPKHIQIAGDSYLYIKGERVVTGTVESVKPTTLITLSEINSILTNNNHNSIKSLAKSAINSQKEGNTIQLHIKDKGHIYHIDTTLHQLIGYYKLMESNITPTYNPQAKVYGYCKDNIFYISYNNGVTKPIITDTNSNVILGDVDCNRSEFGTNEGLYWSPNGESIAIYRVDYSGVDNYPLIDTTTIQPTIANIKYPMAGGKNPEVSIIIYNLSSLSTTYVDNNKLEERYLTNIVWHPNSKQLLISEVNRKQNRAYINSYCAERGSLLKRLYREVSSTYLEPQHKPIFINDNEIVILSRRDGYRHAYKIDTKTNAVTSITSGKWEIISATVSPQRDALYIVTTKDSPLNRTLYSANLKNYNISLLSKNIGFNEVEFSPQSNIYINRFSDSKTPLTITIHSTINNNISAIYRATKPLERYNLPTIECGTLLSADNETELYYRLTKPNILVSKRKYPAIIYVYGGPHVQQITNSYHWGIRGWDIYMAQQGYVVLTVDNRGSDNRGAEFEEVTHRRLGEIEVADQIKGLEFLTSLGYVDSARVGVHGWSFGGFMTLKMLLNHPNRFKVGVAGGSVTNWLRYETIYTERHMGQPKDNTKGYATNNLCNKTNSLNSNLLLIHCDNDPVVPLQHTLAFLNSCIANNKTPQLFIYPNHKHNVEGGDRVHMYEMISRYFFDNL